MGVWGADVGVEEAGSKMGTEVDQAVDPAQTGGAVVVEDVDVVRSPGGLGEVEEGEREPVAVVIDVQVDLAVVGQRVNTAGEVDGEEELVHGEGDAVARESGGDGDVEEGVVRVFGDGEDGVVAGLVHKSPVGLAPETEIGIDLDGEIVEGQGRGRELHVAEVGSDDAVAVVPLGAGGAADGHVDGRGADGDIVEAIEVAIVATGHGKDLDAAVGGAVGSKRVQEHDMLGTLAEGEVEALAEPQRDGLVGEAAVQRQVEGHPESFGLVPPRDVGLVGHIDVGVELLVGTGRGVGFYEPVEVLEVGAKEQDVGDLGIVEVEDFTADGNVQAGHGHFEEKIFGDVLEFKSEGLIVGGRDEVDVSGMEGGVFGYRVKRGLVAGAVGEAQNKF